MRLPYADNFAALAELVEISGEPMPDVHRVPRHDDEILGPSIFRAAVEEAVLENLTLPGLYVGRSELVAVTFSGSDLRLSAFNWSDVTDCDFSQADLSRADLRSCQFSGCSFRGADLTGADLRHSSFDDCTFQGAVLNGAIVSRGAELAGADKAQLAHVVWSTATDEPGGG